MNGQNFRPPAPPGRGDKYLRDVARNVQRVIRTAQRDFRFDALRLRSPGLAELSLILAEFAEDLHNDIGIWRTYEEYNWRWFGVPLPLTEGNDAQEPTAITADRVRHLLWVLYQEFNHDLILGPAHGDFAHVADAVAAALRTRMAPIPRNSGVKQFMQTPNAYGWEIKKKLVWLGTQSYFFRTVFRRYMDENGTDTDDKGIGVTDDFICQECTSWSGLGILDVLAGMLALTDEQRTVLRGWYERHAAFYRVDVVGPDGLEVTNLVNDQPYRVRMGAGPQPFQADAVIFGSLVPWGNDWYWSGTQRQFPSMKASVVTDIKKSLMTNSPQIVYRYRKDLLAKAVAANERQHRQFLEYHQGKDLIVYPDGLSMASDEQRRFRLQYEAEPRESVAKVLAESGLKNPWPEMKYPDNVLCCQDGVGLHYDPNQGVEMMIGFDDVRNGFMKKGCDLSNSEADAIREFIRSFSISPSFVRRMVGEHGDASIRAAFLLRDQGQAYGIKYLLRRYKGAAFRKVYPNMSVVP